MTREVKLNELDGVLEELEYPIDRDRVANELGDVTLILADGRTTVGDVIDGSDADRFASVDDLDGEIRNLLPREAVGEPYQSEGEG